MELIKPKVFHVAQTTLDNNGLQGYLDLLGVPDWVTDAPSDAEKLIEVGGRGCYRSFEPGLNKNVTKIREGNKDYIGNILKSKHGSVIEHAYDTYVFLYVSRVFTHELVRNRIGNSFSQESLRYVRLDSLKCMFPEVFNSHPRRDEIFTEWSASFKEDEDRQIRLATILDLDHLKDFDKKKKLTSAMRRTAPIGLATMIMFTSNHRGMRWAIEQRSDRVAEEEIRMVFAEVYEQQVVRYPNLYQDATKTLVDGINEIKFTNYKV